MYERFKKQVSAFQNVILLNIIVKDQHVQIAHLALYTYNRLYLKTSKCGTIVELLKSAPRPPPYSI